MGRKRIGLIYNPSSNWIAGAYYVQNIVHALNTCSDETKPIIYVYSYAQHDFDELVDQTQYPYLCFRQFYNKETPWQNIIRRFIKKLMGVNWFFRAVPSLFDKIAFVYPISSEEPFVHKSRALAWIPDFQEKYLPELFSRNEIDSRMKEQEYLVRNKIPIVFSSQDSLNDFRRFVPGAESHKSFVLPFAVTHPNFEKENIDVLKNRYGITKPYLFCANQFWQHKNHLLLFSAFAAAVKNGLDLQLVCSGKMSDYRSGTYQDTVRKFIQERHLEEHIRLVGFLERTEQLCLMKNSYAMVQPSLFEGWSTVVEDAKRLNKFIFLSNLRVHYEQAPSAVCFFDPHNELDLTQKLLTVKPMDSSTDYQQNVMTFANKILDIIDEFS